jgi:hypothetical protein
MDDPEPTIDDFATDEEMAEEIPGFSNAEMEASIKAELDQIADDYAAQVDPMVDALARK